MLDEKFTGNGKVVLLAGGGKIYTDIAARFVRSERDLEDIVASPYSKKIVENILSSGHRAAPVSYTHLDVYKRQVTRSIHGAGHCPIK